MTRTFVAATAALVALTVPASARICVVNDPTGTPLNIRLTPNGEVVDRVRNGVRIQVFDGEDKFDSRGRRWYYISLPTSSAPDGYVIADFVRCP